MGTRADFYVGRGESAEWLGSVGWDGYPDGFDAALFAHTDEAAWRAAVTEMLKNRDDATFPAEGWPWPWDDSRTTDYAYAFDGGKVHASSFGSVWFDPKRPEPGEDMPRGESAFPNMKARKAVKFGQGSGLIIYEGGRIVE